MTLTVKNDDWTLVDENDLNNLKLWPLVTDKLLKVQGVTKSDNNCARAGKSLLYPHIVCGISVKVS